jgi:hypothetical protein
VESQRSTIAQRTTNSNPTEHTPDTVGDKASFDLPEIESLQLTTGMA